LVANAETILMGVSRGPWKMGNRAHPDVVHSPNGCLWHPERGEINNVNDGLFIAAARTLVPEMVEEIKRLYAENQRLVEKLDK
jgi:hypothetical protein